MRIAKDHWLKNSTIAHRGLHDDIHPENSMSAFIAGMEKGLPIEIDVHLTLDGEVVIFHDHNTLRVCGVDAEIEKMTYEEIKKLRLSGSDEQIPLLKELAKITTTPILCELKNLTKKVGPLESATLEILKESGCEFAIQSFNPFSLIWFATNAPEILRGQLSTFYEEAKRSVRRYMLKSMWYNKKAKPDFISYDEVNMPNKYVTKYCRKHPETAKLVWTVRSQQRQEELKALVDSFIFEDYMPVKS